MSEAEHLTVSIHLRVSPPEAELIDLRLAYMAEDAASKNGKLLFARWDRGLV